ncbi:MAG: chloride channel protein [Phycisphaeraceae bacterium]|nr:MAG: chloride channel protein [Phycisphaeraceae bacterium]
MSKLDLHNLLKTLSRRLGFQRDWYLILVGAIIGTVTAFGAIGFAELLRRIEHWTSESRADSALWILPAIPMVGALLSGIMIYLWAREAKGHGVPQVLKALIQRNGQIPLRVGIVKVFASIFTVGSGGSAGTEGPIIQIGATAGSVLCRVLSIPREHMRTLVGCGAAAGMASIFNAPIAGVFFVLEILLRDFSIRVFTPIVVASVFSAATTHAFRGENEAIFFAGEKLAGYEFSLFELPSYILLGILCGLIAAMFNWMLHLGEDLFEKAPIHPIGRPVVGAGMLGLLGMGYLLLPGAEGGHHAAPFFGNGYDTIRWLIDPAAYMIGPGNGLTGDMHVPAFFWLLALLVLLKSVATTFTLGSGGSGGVFAPSLFLGAVTGGAVGVGLENLGLIPEGGSPAAYALVGMAAVVAGTTHAPLTAILILFELTRDVFVLLPIMLAAVIATVVSQLINRDSVYTFKLRRAGVLVGAARDLTILRKLRVADVEPEPLPIEPIYASDPVSKLISLHATYHVPDFPVVDQSGCYIGMVTGEDMRTALIDREAIPLLLVAELMQTEIPAVAADDTLDTVMNKFAKHDVTSLCLTRAKSNGELTPLGLVTRGRVLSRYHLALEES